MPSTLALAVCVDGGGDHHADLLNAALLAHPLGERVEPEVAVGPPSSGRSRKLATTVSSSEQILETWLFEMPSQPRERTRSSTRLVETPST